MDDGSLNSRLSDLERRLARIEARLGLADPEYDDRGVPLVRPAPAGPPPLPVINRAPVPAQPGGRDQVVPVASPSVLRPTPAEGGPPVSDPVFTATAVGAPADAGLEQAIGLKWAGWAGAVVLMIGAALGIKFAYDQGWLGLMPEPLRLALMSLAGVALLAAGEVVYRRVSHVSAASLYGAGVAVFFLVSFAGHGHYQLYSRDTAFVLMTLSTLVGAAVALRGGLVSIAVLSLIGGNVAPILMSSDQPRIAAFMSYLLMLQLVALGLCAISRDNKWWALRGLSLATVSVWTAVVIVGPLGDRGPRAVTLGFTLLYAALYHAELLWSARRFDARVAAGQTGPGLSPELARTGVGFGVLVTALLAAGLIWQLREQPREVRGIVTITLAVAAGALGYWLSRTDGPALRAQSVGYRIQAAALAVVAVPVTLSGAWVVLVWGVMSVAFAVLGAALDLPAWRRAAVVTWLLGGIYLAVWTVVDAVPVGRPPVWANVLGVAVPTAAVLAWAMAVLAHAIARLLRETWTPSAEGGATSAGPTPAARPTDQAEATVAPAAPAALQYESRTGVADRPPVAVAPEFEEFAALMTFLGAAAWVLAAVLALPPLGATFMLLAYAGLAVGAYVFAPRLRPPHLLPAGLAVLTLAAVKWLAYDTLARRLSPGWSAAEHVPVLNPTFAAGVLIVLAAGGLLWLTRTAAAADDGENDNSSPSRRRGLARLGPALPAAAGFTALLVLLWAGTLEIDRAFERLNAGVGAFGGAAAPSAPADPTRAKQVMVSIFWSLYAVACVVAGFRLRAAALRYCGLALFAVTLLKVVLIDLGEVSTGWRILSFMGLGLLLLGTSVLYGKLSPKLLGEEERRDGTPASGGTSAAGYDNGTVRG